MSPGTAAERWMVVPSRFCGPPRSGNGGWTAGALAAHLPGGGPESAVTVTLRTPPPLDVALALEREGATTRAMHGETLVAEAAAAPGHPAPVAAVDVETAREAQTRFVGLEEHPFPTCFVCGTARREGDGLRIFPGVVEPDDGRPRVAATWEPHPSHTGPPPPDAVADEPGVVSLAHAWAALDCVAGWSAEGMAEGAMVLGRMTAAVDAMPRIGAEHVVVGTTHRSEGRRTDTSSTLYDDGGRVVARATHTWIAIDPATFR